MRDSRDAKAMARTLRSALAAKGFRITVGQSLELVAEMFGAADWNTLAAAIEPKPGKPKAGPASDSVSPPPPSVEGEAVLPLSPEFAGAHHRALGYANQRNHEYSTLEHLLLALMDDVEAASVMRACSVDFGALQRKLESYLDQDLQRLVVGDGRGAEPTPAFRRVVERARLQAGRLDCPAVTGADALLALFAETKSPAARFLGDEGMHLVDAMNALSESDGKAGGSIAF